MSWHRLCRKYTIHRFYIAFENSNCNDYVTEKYFKRISQLLVPVVLDRRIYEDAGLPSQSFIAADDYTSLKELGNYLNYLRHNDSEYLKYFEWTSSYRKPSTYVTNAVCELCEDIYNEEKLAIDNIEKYFVTNQCTSESHARRILAGASLSKKSR